MYTLSLKKKMYTASQKQAMDDVKNIYPDEQVRLEQIKHRTDRCWDDIENVLVQHGFMMSVVDGDVVLRLVE